MNNIDVTTEIALTRFLSYIDMMCMYDICKEILCLPVARYEEPLAVSGEIENAK